MRKVSYSLWSARNLYEWIDEQGQHERYLTSKEALEILKHKRELFLTMLDSSFRTNDVIKLLNALFGLGGTGCVQLEVVTGTEIVLRRRN